MEHELFSQNAESVLEYAVSLTQGENQNRPLAARILEGLSYFHPQPAACLRSLAQLLGQGGGGLERDLQRRFEVLQFAAIMLDDEQSLFLVAVAHYQGHGTERNDITAIAAFERIWDGNGPLRFDAGLMMGRMFRYGSELLPADPARAIQTYDTIRSSADDDFSRVEAALYMGQLLREGPPGVEVDSVRAFQAYLDVAELEDNEDVLYELAQMYEHGEGLDGPEMEEAQRWYEEAAAQDHGPAIERLEELGI